MARIDKELDKIKHAIKKQEKKIEETDNIAGDKVDFSTFINLKELILQLPRAEKIKQLEDKVTQNIDKFRKDNDTFRKDFTLHQEIIRRYDEVLAQKVSKVKMEEEMMKLYDDFDG